MKHAKLTLICDNSIVLNSLFVPWVFYWLGVQIPLMHISTTNLLVAFGADADIKSSSATIVPEFEVTTWHDLYGVQGILCSVTLLILKWMWFLIFADIGPQYGIESIWIPEYGVRSTFSRIFKGRQRLHPYHAQQPHRQMLTINDSDRLVESFRLVLPAEDDRQWVDR